MEQRRKKQLAMKSQRRASTPKKMGKLKLKPRSILVGVVVEGGAPHLAIASAPVLLPGEIWQGKGGGRVLFLARGSHLFLRG